MEKDKGIFSFRKHPVGELLGGKKERKRKMHRALGMLLAAALIVGTLPASGLAVSASGREAGLCEHHSEHTAECGYKEAQPCTHEHGEECYRTVTECVHGHTDGCYPETEESTGEGSATDSDAESREPSKCTHECSEESGCITKVLDCHHEHDESCGYQEAQECGYVCEICNGKKSEDTENTEDADVDTAECVCKVLCTEDSINGDCPVCGADDASLLYCKGKVSEENTENQEDTGICKHHQEHDADCGYIPESEDGEGSPCTYECRICPVEDLIAALPDKITEDNGSDVRAQLEEILAFYRELSEDEQEQIDISRCLRLQEALNAGNVTAPAAEGTPDLELFGQKVCSGDSGDGWSYEAGVLTLEDFHADNSSEDFIHVTNVDLDFTLYVKGDNSVKTSGKLIWGSVYGSMTITGEQGASLSLDGKSWSDRYISIYGVTMDVTMQEMIFLAYDMEIDNATVSFNMSGASGYIYTTHGGFTVKNGSNVTITNSSGVAEYCVVTNKAEITDSTLEMINPSGFGVYVTKLSQQPSEYKASVTNSTISADVLDAAVHCEEEVSVADSQVTGSGRFLLRSKKAITVDGSSTMEGITYKFFKSDTGAVYQVYGDHTLAANLTVAENGSFVIPEEAALTIPDGVTLENNGTMRIHDKTSLTGTGVLAGSGEFLIDVNEDMIFVPEDLIYTGEDYTDQITLEESVTIGGVEFTADTEGWTRNISPAVVKDAGEYTVTFTKEDKEISKTFTVAQSGTDLASKGKVLTYNGDTQTTTFSADDTITVKAAPTATGTAPQKAAARLSGEPGAGQMALYVGNTLVSSQAVDAGEDGTYTMEVSASDVLTLGGAEPNGDPIPLTAKFVGNDNMADAAGTVKVNISAVARVEKDSTTTYVDKNGLYNVFAYGSGYEDATVTLLDDLTITDYENLPKIDIRCTLNLNGHTIRSDLSSVPTLEVIANGNVTIAGSGEIVSSKDAALKVVGTAVLEGGTFCSGGTYHGAVEVLSGNLSVTGENVVMENTGSGNGLLIYNLEAVRLSAGKYSGAAGAISVSDNDFTISSLLDQKGTSRVAYYKDNATLVTEGLDGQTLPSGSYTVRACTHSYKYTHTESTTTHSQTCLACGDKKTTETCSYVDGKCACGSTLSAALADTEKLVYSGSPHTPDVTVTLDGTELTAAGYDVTYADNVNAGTDTATVTVTGKGSYNFEIKKTFSIEKAEQKDFAVVAETKPYEKNGTFTLSTTGGGGDGAVLYRVPENNGVLMVNGNTAVIIGVGTVTVTAAKAESDNYKAVTATGNITIKKASAPAITYPTAGSITYGQKLSDCALTGGSTEYGTFAWENGSTMPAVDNTGYMVIFTASEETKKNYETITNTTKKVSVKVEQAVPAVSIKAALSGSKDSRQAVITVNVAKAGAGAFPTGTVTFINCTGSTEVEIGTATLSNGTASYTWDGITDQTYTIKVVYAGNSNYMETESRELTFDAAKQNQQDFALDAIGAKTYGDAAVILKTTGGSGNGAVRYESSDEDVIRIENGRAVITGAGTAVITAIKEEDDNYNEASASRNVTVAKKALTVKADSKTVVRGNPMPVFTYRTNGLVNGDTFTTDPSITAGAQNTDTLGKYDIVISGGTLQNSENYRITYVNGTLNIVERFYTVTVTDGTGGGEYAEGDTVTVTANERNGYTFTGWSSKDGAAFADSKAKTTTFTMPARSVAVKANYTRNNSGGNNSGGSGNGGNSDGPGNNGGGNSGGNEDNGGSGGNDEGQGSGGNGSTNPGNGNTAPRPSVIPPIDTGAGTGNETAPGTGTTPAGPGSGNTSRQGTAPGSGSAGIPAQGLKQPFIKGADGKIGWDVIRAEEEQAQEGSIINVDMNGSTVVPGDIFDSIKGKDITVTFDMGSGILWSVNGKEVITDKAGDIDFSVKAETNAIPVDIVNNVTGERYSIQISLAYDGEFGFTAVLSIDLGRENAGYTASLYYYNESAGELEFICSDEIAEDGTVSLAFTHASDYVIAIDGDEESGSAAEPAQPEKQDGDSTIPADENPQAVQAWRLWWIIVAGALVIIVGIGVFFVVKKKQEDENSGQ